MRTVARGTAGHPEASGWTVGLDGSSAASSTNGNGQLGLPAQVTRSSQPASSAASRVLRMVRRSGLAPTSSPSPLQVALPGARPPDHKPVPGYRMQPATRGLRSPGALPGWGSSAHIQRPIQGLSRFHGVLNIDHAYVCTAMNNATTQGGRGSACPSGWGTHQSERPDSCTRGVDNRFHGIGVADMIPTTSIHGCLIYKKI